MLNKLLVCMLAVHYVVVLHRIASASIQCSAKRVVDVRELLLNVLVEGDGGTALFLMEII